MLAGVQKLSGYMKGICEMRSASDFMDYMGYRNVILEEKIEECLSAVGHGETEITLDSGDLTDEEIDYIPGDTKKNRLLKCMKSLILYSVVQLTKAKRSGDHNE